MVENLTHDVIYSSEIEGVRLNIEEVRSSIAEIVNILVDEQYLGADGKPDINKMGLIAYNPIQHAYHALGEQVGLCQRASLRRESGGGRRGELLLYP